MSTLSELFTLRLPDYRTPAEALAFHELLNNLAEATWNCYEAECVNEIATFRSLVRQHVL